MGRPRTPLLSADRIADAALELVNATGGFTMPALAARLGVRPSSLYNHVAGRDAIVELLRERAMSEVELPSVDPDEPARPWRDAVADIARSYRRSYARYPRLIPLLTAYSVNSASAITMYNTLAATLVRAGFDHAETLRVITLIDYLVLGSALDVAAPEEPWLTSAEVGKEFAAALATATPNPQRADDVFEYGLSVLLAGLEP